MKTIYFPSFDAAANHYRANGSIPYEEACKTFTELIEADALKIDKIFWSCEMRDFLCQSLASFLVFLAYVGMGWLLVNDSLLLSVFSVLIGCLASIVMISIAAYYNFSDPFRTK